MSKAFTKDDDAGSEPVVFASRAPLPPDTPNYVTPRGLALLQSELSALELERKRLAAQAEDAERRRASAILSSRVAELSHRIATAELVPAPGARDEVRFGATVHTSSAEGSPRVYRIVGVDEADAAHGSIAFVAPLARALLGRRVGDGVIVRTPRGEEELEITAVEYDEAVEPAQRR
jgi:transcription elongation factor GreB